MPDKKINELPTLTDTEVNNNAFLMMVGNPSTGQLFQVTIAQMKILLSGDSYYYTATGSEGSTITIGALSGKDVKLIFRESGPIYEVGSAPASAEFTWNGTSIGLGAPVGGAGERFLILYTN